MQATGKAPCAHPMPRHQFFFIYQYSRTLCTSSGVSSRASVLLARRSLTLSPLVGALGLAAGFAWKHALMFQSHRVGPVRALRLLRVLQDTALRLRVRELVKDGRLALVVPEQIAGGWI